MKKWQKCRLVGIALTAVFVAACGGGGGGGDDLAIADAAYTGVRTQAYLDADNAEALVLGAYGGVAYEGIFPLATAGLSAPGISPAKISDPFNLLSVFKQTAAVVKQDFQIKPQALLDPAEICVNYPDGTTSDTLEASDSGTTVSLKGTVTFSSCDTGEGIILDGTVNLSASVNLDTFLLTRLSMTMNPLSVNDGTATYTLYGKLSGNETLDNSSLLVIHLTLDATIEDPSGKTFWLNNYEIDDTEEASGIRSTVSGRYYENDYGYVDFSTLETIYVPYDPSESTYDGLIEFIGSEGSHANLWLGVNQSDYCINVFNTSGVVDIGTCVP